MIGDAASLAAMNHKKLSVLAERFGTNPTASHVEQMYLDLLRIVDNTATASRVADADKKVIPRRTATTGGRTTLEIRRLRSSEPRSRTAQGPTPSLPTFIA